MRISTELLKGVLEGVVLHQIDAGINYGYEITKTLRELGFDDLAEGTVYTILVRLEKNELVNVEKHKSEKGPMKKFYQLNDAGKTRLTLFWTHWDFLINKMAELRKED
ncbi:PadR family transcriptional regulator [Paucilactobacillus wasatchensis]|uniref:Transcriptional regulator, PadR family n=1 Tax=Paucilactobacillus wasatchensis TaxID=1335616 RepID=A0A0D0YYG9_9LACO|nr:PadR family transcriptional regulator [Paucilactobacillus wasatchensis]KIS04269.1 Transcriptional regulator, PadR family [Paucilactobacillus wasatchensis]